MSDSAKVLTGLTERHALEAELRGLAEIHDLDQLAGRAQAIASRGRAVLPALLRLLDTQDPQLRGGLGEVAARLEREQVVPALRRVARARDRSELARLTAMTILNRYLQEPLDETMMAGLHDPDAVAMQSLRELLHEMAGNQFAVIEYLRQLAEQPPEVPWIILNAVPRMPADPHLITLLRMFAQGEDERLARAALEQLGRTRTTEAARALAGLTATLPPERAALAERSLRKLRLAGVPEPELPEPIGWRALLPPIDSSGVQAVWFVQAPNAAGLGTLFGVLYKDPEGIIASFGSTNLPVSGLPPEQPPGSLHVIRMARTEAPPSPDEAGEDLEGDAPPILLLEVTFNTGRELVRRALEMNWASGHPTPPEYRLLNYLIWEQRG